MAAQQSLLPTKAPARLSFVVDGEPVPKARPRARVVQPMGLKKVGGMLRDLIASAAERGAKGFMEELTRIAGELEAADDPFAQFYTPKETQQYEERVQACASNAVSAARWVPDEEARFCLLLRVYTTYAKKRGDWDNYAKAAGDAMNGVVYRDDKAICKAAVIVEQDRARPRMEVEVVELT